MTHVKVLPLSTEEIEVRNFVVSKGILLADVGKHPIFTCAISFHLHITQGTPNIDEWWTPILIFPQEQNLGESNVSRHIILFG